MSNQTNAYLQLLPFNGHTAYVFIRYMTPRNVLRAFQHEEINDKENHITKKEKDSFLHKTEN